MTPLALVITLLCGGLVGLVSGLVGVGGGIVMVPFLYFLLTQTSWAGIHVPPAHHAAVAHATSLLVIVPTAITGIVAYHRSRMVVWRVALPMAGVAVLAALAGVQVAVRLPSEVLKAGFGAFLFVSGLNLLGGSRQEVEGGSRGGRGIALAILGGLGVGFTTALLGVGGGIVAIPLLIYLVRLDVKKVAATSLGVVVFSAFAAALSFALTGWGHPELPAGSVGFLFLPAALALLPGALLTVRFGVRINQKLGAGALKILFGVVFLLVGLRLFLGNLGAALG